MEASQPLVAQMVPYMIKNVKLFFIIIIDWGNLIVYCGGGDEWELVLIKK